MGIFLRSECGLKPHSEQHSESNPANICVTTFLNNLSSSNNKYCTLKL